jgi:hypothetical protein
MGQLKPTQMSAMENGSDFQDLLWQPSVCLGPFKDTLTISPVISRIVFNQTSHLQGFVCFKHPRFFYFKNISVTNTTLTTRLFLITEVLTLLILECLESPDVEGPPVSGSHLFCSSSVLACWNAVVWLRLSRAGSPLCSLSSTASISSGSGTFFLSVLEVHILQAYF